MKYRLLTLTNRGIRGQRDGEIRYCMCEVRDQTVGDRLVNKINTHLYVFFSLFAWLLYLSLSCSVILQLFSLTVI